MSETKTSETSEMPKHPNVEISVKNFGPIADATIDLRPLTVFVGPSNTGKTYFSTLIYVLHKVFEGFSRLPLPETFRTSAKVGYGAQGTFLPTFASSQEEVLEIIYKLSTNDRSFRFSDLPQGIRKLAQSVLKDPELWEHNLGGELRRCFDLDSISELIQLAEVQNNEMSVSLKTNEKTQELWYFNMKATESEIFVDGAFNEDMVILAKEKWYAEASSSAKKLSELCPELFPHPDIDQRVCYYLPAARGGIMQSHRIIASSLVDSATRAGVATWNVPTFSGIVADFMKRLILYNEASRPKDNMADLADALELEVLSGQVIMKPSVSGYPDFLYRPRSTKQDIRMSRVSSMVSELAPVVLFLRGGIRLGDTLIIEEPEAHLHPGAQTEVALTLAGLVRAGVRVVVTTHSDWLLKEIANLIRIGELKRKGVQKVKKMAPAHWLFPEEVGTWWFQKDGIVKHIPFDRTEGIEPKDYEDVADKLYDSSVNLQDLLEEVDREDNEWD